MSALFLAKNYWFVYYIVMRVDFQTYNINKTHTSSTSKTASRILSKTELDVISTNLRSHLQPFIHVLLGSLQRGTLRMLLLNILDEVFRVFPVCLIGLEGKNLILCRPIRNRFFF